ncbi:MAG: hypothetical protein GF331_07370 [Chitinivibrionales bacterium]|nr:hypothetical protein [Chitinivibrionales bacterium]
MTNRVFPQMILVVLALATAGQAAEVTVTMKKGSPEVDSVAPPDYFPIRRQVPSNTVSSFGIATDSGTDYTLLADVRAVTVEPSGPDDTVAYLIVTANGKGTAYELDGVDSITFVDLATDDGSDTDDDGLSDFAELNRYQTDPRKADTDGDGWSDYDELGWYSPANAHLWNPCIADMPRLEIVQLAQPSFSLLRSISETETKEESIVSGREYTSTQTQSSSFSSSYAAEIGWEAGFSVMLGFEDVKPVGEFTVFASANGSYTTETSQEFGREWSSENAISYERAETRASENSWEITGASMAVPIRLHNNGPIAYRITALTLTAYSQFAPLGKGEPILDLLGSVNLQDNDAIFQEITLNPNSESGVLSFVNSSLTYETAKAWALRGRDMTIALSGYTMAITALDGTVRDFTHEMTAVAASTARLRLDFGPGFVDKKPLELAIAARNQYNVNHTNTEDRYFTATIGDMLRTAKIPVTYATYDGKTGITAVDGVAHEPEAEGYWFVSLCHPPAGTATQPTFELYSVANASYTLDTVGVQPGDIVDIIYAADRDGDGVPHRFETLYGCSDTLTDSDGDGISDSLELFGWQGQGGTLWRTNPANDDTDGDTLTDNEDPNPLRRQLATSTDLQGVSFRTIGLDGSVTNSPFDSISLDPASRDSLEGGLRVSGPSHIGPEYVLEDTTLHIRVHAPLPLAAVEVWAVSLDGGVIADSSYRRLPSVAGSNNRTFEANIGLPPLADISNRQTVRIRLRTTSEDSGSTRDHLFTLVSVQPRADAGDFVLSLTSNGIDVHSYDAFLAQSKWQHIGGRGYDNLVFVYSTNITQLENYKPLTVAFMPKSGDMLAEGVYAADVLANPANSGVIEVLAKKLKFNQTYHMRAITYRRNSADDFVLAHGTTNNIATTGEARVKLCARKFLNLESRDDEDNRIAPDAWGYTAEYRIMFLGVESVGDTNSQGIFTTFDFQPYPFWQTAMVGTPPNLGYTIHPCSLIVTEDMQTPYEKSMRPGDSIHALISIDEMDTRTSSDRITLTHVTFVYDEHTEPATTNMSIIGPPDTVYERSMRNAMPAPILRKRTYEAGTGVTDGGKVSFWFYCSWAMVDSPAH